MNFLRYIIWNLQAEVTPQPRIGATEAPRPPRQPLWVEAGTVERLLRGKPSARTLAVLACALSKVREAEARRCRVRNLTLIQGRLGVQPLMRRDGRRIPSRFALVPGWARPLLLPWAAACRAAGLRDEDYSFPSEDDPRRPVSGLAHLLDAACRRVGLPPIRWQDWGRIREAVRPEVIATAVRSAL